MKFGVNVLLVQSDFGVSSNARGNITFNGIFTAKDDTTAATRTSGEGYADFLLGWVGATTLTTFLEGALRANSYEFFLQDDWKATPRLTVNWGLRYDIWQPYVEKDDKQANFDLPSLKLIQAKPDGSRFERALIHTDKNNIAPRLGLAYKLTPWAVLRTGYGIFFSNYDQTGASGRPAANPPFFFQNTYPNDRRKASYLLQNGVPAVGTASALQLIGWDPHFPLPYAQQWSMNLQLQLRGDLMVEVGYTGNKGTKYQSSVDANAPRPGPGGPQPRRPFPNLRLPGLPAIVANMDMTGPNVKSVYHAGLLTVQKRFSRGLSYHAS